MGMVSSKLIDTIVTIVKNVAHDTEKVAVLAPFHFWPKNEGGRPIFLSALLLAFCIISLKTKGCQINPYIRDDDVVSIYYDYMD
jgi:hypothetical protein